MGVSPSVQMRLRKRKRRSSIKETWEVVQKQGADETLSILTYNVRHHTIKMYICGKQEVECS